MPDINPPSTPEPADPNPQSTIRNPQSELPQAIRDLVAAQGGMTDTQFVREYNWPYSEATWSRVKRGIYKGDNAKALAACEAMLRRVRERRALAGKVRQGTRYIEFTPMRTILDRIPILHSEPTQNRLLMYLAPTGGGKSALGREIAARHAGILVEARESWRQNYFAALLDVCAAAGVAGEDYERSPRAAEAALIAHLRARKQVLVIDEGEYFGPRSLNLIKLILNQTPTVVVLMAIPALWDRVQSRAWVEAAQIMRRTDHVERLQLVHPDEAERFLADHGVALNGGAGESARIVARHANEFGRFDLIARVAARLADGEVHPPAEVETVCITVKAQIGFITR